MAERFEKALEMISRAQRPFLYAGGGVISSEAAPELAAFAEKLDAPVACSLMCQGGFDQANRRYMGMLGMHGTNTAALAIKNCDLFVAVGTRFSDRVLCNAGLFARHCPIIQIEIDTAEFNKNIEVQLKVKGDAKEILQKLNEMLPQQEHTEWMDQVAAWKQEFPLIQKERTPHAVTPQQVMETLDRLTDDDAIIATEVGQNQMWAAQFYTFRKPRTFLSSGGLGTMGFGLGAALGAKVGNPDRPGDQRRGRRQLPHEPQRAGHRRGLPYPVPGARAQQRGAGHGAPVAEAVLRPPFFADGRGHCHRFPRPGACIRLEGLFHRDGRPGGAGAARGAGGSAEGPGARGLPHQPRRQRAAHGAGRRFR